MGAGIPITIDRSRFPVDRRTDAIDRHLHSRASPRFVATNDEVPDTTDRPELFYVEGPPEEIWLVTSTGKRILGFSVHAAATSSVTLGTVFQDIPGTLITLPKPGVYIIIATFDMRSISTVSDFIIQGILATEAGVAVDPPREAILYVQGDKQRATVGQTWRVTTTTDDEKFVLRGNHTTGTGAATIEITHTTIAAFSLLGGGVGGGNGGDGTPGYVEYHPSTVTLADIQVTPTDVPNCSVTLPVAGTYVIQAAFDFQFVSQPTPVTGVAGVGRLTNASNVEEDAEARFQHPSGSGDALAGHRATVFQQWEITSTTPNEVYKLRANKSASTAGVRVDAKTPGTTILAYSVGGGGSGGPIAHEDLTTSPPSAHHTRYTDSEVDVRIAIHAALDHHEEVSAGVGIDVTGQIVSHKIGSTTDFHDIYQLRSEAHGGGGYGSALSREYQLLAMELDGGFLAALTS